MEEAMTTAPTLDARQLRRGTNTGAWLTVLPPKMKGTELGDQVWCDALFLRFGIEPLDLPTHCDGCNTKFSICRALDCK